MNPAKERFRMPELNEKLLEPLEKMKGIQKMEFGYFKHLATLSTGSTLILIAFFEKVFSFPRGEGWALASIGCFALCVVGSMLALQSANNLVLVPIGIKMILVSGKADEEKAEKKRAEKRLFVFFRRSLLKSLKESRASDAEERTSGSKPSLILSVKTT